MLYRENACTAFVLEEKHFETLSLLFVQTSSFGELARGLEENQGPQIVLTADRVADDFLVMTQPDGSTDNSLRRTISRHMIHHTHMWPVISLTGPTPLCGKKPFNGRYGLIINVR